MESYFTYKFQIWQELGNFPKEALRMRMQCECCVFRPSFRCFQYLIAFKILFWTFSVFFSFFKLLMPIYIFFLLYILTSVWVLVCTRTLADCFIPKKDNFDQRLECAAPKSWSKYTTSFHITKEKRCKKCVC